jgi:hypothetical protein
MEWRGSRWTSDHILSQISPSLGRHVETANSRSYRLFRSPSIDYRHYYFVGASILTCQNQPADCYSLVSLQSGGYTHSWTSGYVLAQLIIGILLIISWVVWEAKYAPYPMIPRELFQGQRVVALAFLIAFIAGFDFYSVINFFPLSFSTVWSPDPVQVGLKGLGYGISTTVGAVFFNSLLSTRLPAKYILLISAVLMSKS